MPAHSSHLLQPLDVGFFKSQVAPSIPYSSAEGVAPLPKLSTAGKKVTELANMMKLETVKLYEERFEGYDVENDELYSIWSRMKKLTISDPPANRQDKEVASGTEQERIPRVQQKVSCALDEVLTYPNPPADKRRKESPLHRCLNISPVSK